MCLLVLGADDYTVPYIWKAQFVAGMAVTMVMMYYNQHKDGTSGVEQRTVVL